MEMDPSRKIDVLKEFSRRKETAYLFCCKKETTDSM
jgi:hypothetical protein